MEHSKATRILILGTSKQVYKKKLEQINTKIKKQSEKLFTMDDSNSTVRRRAMARVSLSTVCEERDGWQKRLDEIQKWETEIKGIRN